ncbi:MAG: hypothetical protein J0H19_00865 [Rhodospirillales bacterium]|nr:hypothetical protein [Rhodospirillales bacterium]
MRRLALIAGLLLLPTFGLAQAPPAHPPAQAASEPDGGAGRGRTEIPRLPGDVTTQHTLDLPSGPMRVMVTAGAIRLPDDHGGALADIAFVAYRRPDADPRSRPVTFVFNGGPGMASGWLQVGAVGPWRIPLVPSPSAPADPEPNADTWLDMTDLVFLDPPGTGYARVLGGEDARRTAWSVEGDIDLLAQAIRRWLDRNDRMGSPKYLLGESYGGFRAPRLTRRLQEQEGVGISGMVLLSPALDLGRIAPSTDPMALASRLPSEVAALRGVQGPVTRDSLGDVEAYAAGDYVTDLLRGVRDDAAVERLSAAVARLTGLDPALVRRYQGRLGTDVFLHEIARARAEIGSPYDATILTPDPTPLRLTSRAADPMLDGLRAPITAAMVSLYHRFGWQPDRVYHLVGDAAFRSWNWGRGTTAPESMGALQTALALDPRLRVLVAHGMFDLVTPYFATELLLRQVPAFAGPSRLRLVVYPGGHMFYSDDASRAALHRDAAALYPPN